MHTQVRHSGNPGRSSEAHLEWESLSSVESIRKYLNHKDSFSNRERKTLAAPALEFSRQPEQSKVGESEYVHTSISRACSDKGWHERDQRGGRQIILESILWGNLTQSA